jgi:hypothetical protein
MPVTTLAPSQQPAAEAAVQPLGGLDAEHGDLMPRVLFHSLLQRLAIVATLLVAAASARAAAINTGVENILWPVIIVGKPFLVVHDLLFGSDHSARESADEAALKILEAQRQPIPTHGLFTGPLDLNLALYGILVEARLPFIEIETAGSAWLLSMAKSPQPLIAKALQSRFIRISLGSEGDPHCFEWKSSAGDWVQSPPVRPGTCMQLHFTDDLRSDRQLQVDASQIGRRRLMWILSDRTSGQVQLSVPFWQPQTKDQPLRVSVAYRAAHETGTFSSLLHKLTPDHSPTDVNGMPLIMNRISYDPKGEAKFASMKYLGLVRSPMLDWTAITASRTDTSWQASYARARATNQPQVIGTLLIVPQTDSVGSSCAFAYRRGCDFAKSYVSELGVMTVGYSPAYKPDRPSTTETSGHPLSVGVAARGFDGQMLWGISITPASLPTPFAACEDQGLSCFFYPDQLALTDQELVVLGRFQMPNQPRSIDTYEMVISRERLPQPLLQR